MSNLYFPKWEYITDESVQEAVSAALRLFLPDEDLSTILLRITCSVPVFVLPYGGRYNSYSAA